METKHKRFATNSIFSSKLMPELPEKEFLKLALRTVGDVPGRISGKRDGHFRRSALTLERLIKGMIDRGIYAEELIPLDLGMFVESSRLHDIGKVSIRHDILHKPGRLTPAEFEIMKRHVAYGVDAIDRIQNMTEGSCFLSYARIMAESHHEKWDGSGYPFGLAGHDIPLYGRLMAIADVYDALVSVRPYKKAYPHKKALEIIAALGETHFDPLVTQAFLDIFQSGKRGSRFS